MTSDKKPVDADLVRAYKNRSTLRAFARRTAGEDEEDIVQDAFLKIVERSRRKDIPTVDNLLSHIVRCFSVDRQRRLATRSAYLWAVEGESAVDAASDPERFVMGAERLKRVMAAIDAMPERRREVFLMHRIEEMSYAQIARQFGVSIKAVEKHMHLAMRQLSDTDD